MESKEETAMNSAMVGEQTDQSSDFRWATGYSDYAKHISQHRQLQDGRRRDGLGYSRSVEGARG